MQCSSTFLLWVVVLTLLIGVKNAAFAQAEQTLESILEQVEDESAENAGWLEYLWELKENPLDLNRAGLDDLTRISFLSPSLSQNIIQFRKRRKQFRNYRELLKVEGMTRERWEALAPFVTVHPISVRSGFIYRAKTYYQLPQRIGYRQGKYANPLYLQNRFIFRFGEEFSGGAVVEKDAGEQDNLDYLSYHLRYRNRGQTTSVLVGDYQMRVGCGLALWSAYGLPLTPAALPLLPNVGTPFSGNRGTNEFHFLRGVVLQQRVPGAGYLNLFYSRENLDATLSPDSQSVSSFYTAGLHRSETEQAKKGNLQLVLYGASFRSHLGKLQFQFTPVISKFEPLYQDFSPTRSLFSLSYRFSGGSAVRHAGEVVLSQGKFPAVQQYLIFRSQKIRYQVTGYYYHPSYFALFGRAFGALSRTPQNRLGTALMAEYRFSSATRVGGYAHFYRKIRSSESNLFVFRDYLLEVSQRFAGQMVKLQFRQKYRENDVENSPALEKKIYSLRLSYYLRAGKKLRLQNRIELRWAKPLIRLNRYYGFSMFHQAEWNPGQQLRLIARWTSFDVPDYDLRIYEYEPDLPGSFRMMLLNNRGYKWFFLLRWHPAGFVQLDFKYQQRTYPELKTIGAGADEISGNRTHEFRMSLILKY